VIARSLSALRLYDVLANLVPGVVLIVALLAVFQIQIPTPRVGLILGITAILALVVGHIIQYLASRLDGTPHLFGDVIKAAQGQSSGDDLPISLTYIEQNAWPMMQERFDLPEGFEDYGALFRLLLSYVESTPATRALRFQAIHTLHRSLWATGILLVAVAIVGLLLNQVLPTLARGCIVSAAVLISGCLMLFVFGRRKEKFNRLFVQYAIADFYAFETKD